MSLSEPAAAPSSGTYVDRDGFSFAVPEGWRTERGAAGLLVSVIGPSDQGGFRPNLNVVRKVRDRAPDLDALAREALKTLSRLLTDLLVVDVDTSVVANLPARRLLVAYRQGLFALTSEQWIFADHDHIWTVSAGAATDQWDRVADDFTQIVRSLEVKG